MLISQRQVRDLQIATSQPLGSVFSIVATASFSLGLAMYFSWKLTLVTICTIPVIILILAWLGSHTQGNVNMQQSKLTEALRTVTSALNSIDTVKCFNGQEVEVSKYLQKITEAAQWYYRTVNMNAQQAGFTQFMGSAMFVQAFYYGGVLVDSGQKSTGDVVTTFMSALGAFGCISAIIGQMLFLEKGRTAGATLRAIIAEVEKSSADEVSNTHKMPAACRGEISFENVRFSP